MGEEGKGAEAGRGVAGWAAAGWVEGDKAVGVTEEGVKGVAGWAAAATAAAIGPGKRENLREADKQGPQHKLLDPKPATITVALARWGCAAL